MLKQICHEPNVIEQNGHDLCGCDSRRSRRRSSSSRLKVVEEHGFALS